MSDIFLSYAKEDREDAVRMADLLDIQGWEVFWDREIPVGGSWPEVLETELPGQRLLHLFGRPLRRPLAGYSAKQPMATRIISSSRR